jgi:hypothetical protein
MNAQDLYLKTIDPTGKYSASISHHRVWDRELFLKSQRAMHAKKIDTPDFREVVPVDETAYRKDRNYKVI